MIGRVSSAAGGMAKMASLWFILVTELAFLGINGQIQTEEELFEYCEGETFHAACAEDQVVIMGTAYYGRMRLGKCLNVATDDMGCRSDVLSLFDQLCSGRHECEVRVSSIIDMIPDSQLPCPMDFRSYLEASFHCVKVIQVPQEICVSSSSADVTATSGHLASITTEETTCGSLDCPWILRMPAGQTIEINLYDFAAATRDQSNFDNNVPIVCHVYAVVKETSIKSSETICGTTSRQTLAYTSVTNSVEIRMVAKRKSVEDGYFLLHYKVHGCADLPDPRFGWAQRQGDKTTLGCNATKKSWTLTCEGSSWTGESFNCTQADPTTNSVGLGHSIFTGSQWASIVIILAIAVTIGLFIFLIGLILLRRKRSLQSRHQHSADGRLPIPDYYSTNYSREGGVSPYASKPLSSMDYSSSENDYYRTWQLQRHPPGVRGFPAPGAHGNFPAGGSGMCPNHGQGHGPYNTMDTQHRVSEHIYESPKFDRREIPYESASSDLGLGLSAQYHELDPESDAQRNT